MARRARGRRGGATGSGEGLVRARRCVEVGCSQAAEAGSRFCRGHGMGEVARAERRAALRLMGDLEGAALGTAGGDPGERAAELWRRAARGDYGDLLEERLGKMMAAGEVGRVRGLLGQLVGALEISLDEVMVGEADPHERSLAVSRLAHAATRVVATRRAEVAQAADADRAEASKALRVLLEELDTELDGSAQGNGEGEVKAVGRYGEEMDGGRL